eukprot:gnl/TRDRNA2_/TRDRNA2_173891_c0_seq4.p1 gnl/TRDRNA2_/TRDRNA2_173891_c0~~gnl/TRDRNA2_/TRDRNA2_173891_c0_seq4.p1  ORF type:complete len:262 (+),score=3.97 gnl/TRDRNA2_/TRDRNA2_173891_c0_seq4:62-847(+)
MNIYMVVLPIVLGNWLSLDALRLPKVTNSTQAAASSAAKLPKVHFGVPLRTSPAQQPPATTTDRNVAHAAKGHPESIPATLHQGSRVSGAGGLAQASGHNSNATNDTIGNNATATAIRYRHRHHTLWTNAHCTDGSSDYTDVLDVVMGAGQSSEDTFMDQVHNCSLHSINQEYLQVNWTRFKTCVEAYIQTSFSAALSDPCLGCFHYQAQYGLDYCDAHCLVLNDFCKRPCLTCLSVSQSQMSTCMNRSVTGYPWRSCCNC